MYRCCASLWNIMKVSTARDSDPRALILDSGHLLGCQSWWGHVPPGSSRAHISLAVPTKMSCSSMPSPPESSFASRPPKSKYPHPPHAFPPLAGAAAGAAGAAVTKLGVFPLAYATTCALAFFSNTSLSRIYSSAIRGSSGSSGFGASSSARTASSTARSRDPGFQFSSLSRGRQMLPAASLVTLGW